MYFIFRKLLLSILFFPIGAFCLEKATIALVFDGKTWKENAFVSLVKEEIYDLLQDEFDIEFSTFVDEWSESESATLLQEALSDPEIDVVIPFGILASAAAVAQPELPKPVVLAYDIRLFADPPYTTTAHLPNNLIYFKGKRDFLTDLRLFDEVTHARNLAVIGDRSLLGGDSSLHIRRLIEATAESVGNRVELISVEDDPQPALEALKEGEFDGVFLLPTWRLSPENLTVLISGINDLFLPSFSFLGEEEVTQGVLMSTSSDAERKRVARRIALNTLEVLTHGDLSSVVIPFSRADQLVINEKTAKAIGLNLTWKTLSEAKLVDKVAISPSEVLDLKESVDLAVRCNFDLSAQRYAVRSGKQLVMKTLAPLLPQLGSEMAGRRIDQNQAKFGFGSSPQRLLRGSLQFKQNIYDDKKSADYSIEKKLQKARVWQKREVELDVMQNTSVAYLSVLQLASNLHIALENLNLTKANLRRAHELVDSGQARLSEVYRWESELSSNRETLATIEARLENVKAEFNRVVNRPMRAPVHLQDIYPDHPSFHTDLGSLVHFINTPKRFDLFKKYMINLAREHSPEVGAIDEEIQAQRRQHTQTKRAFYIPVITAFADVEKNMWKRGAGSTPPPGISNTKTESTIGISLSYPLFTGGERKADMNKALFDLMKLKQERGSIIQQVDERVIQEADRLKANFENISFAKNAKEAAEKNLVIVTNSYARGVVSIVDLIDAQNTAIVSKTSYSNAVYDYLIVFMRMQRAIGQFIYFYSPEEKEVFVQEVKNYLQSGDVIHAL